MKISERHKKQASRIIRQINPNQKQYRKYQKDGMNFFTAFNMMNFLNQNYTNAYSFEWVSSEHFKKLYLVGFVKKNWFYSLLGTHCDAAATESFMFAEASSPPIVLIPGKTFPKKKGFQAILEHEFVHVSQMISRGNAPSLSTCPPTAEAIFKQLCNLTKFEYEAYFVQLSHDPTFFPRVLESLEEWCSLRGYTEGLETAVFRLCTEGRSLSQIKIFFNLVKSKLPDAFDEIGLDRKIGESFVTELPRVWPLVILTVLKKSPEIVNNRTFISLMKWSNPNR